MKWLFVALLLVNAGLAAFQWVKHREQEVVPLFERVKNVDDIELLSDRVISVVGREGGTRCSLLGPINSQQVLRSVREKLGGVGSWVRVVEQEVERAPSYWVYMMANENARDLVGVVKGLGIDTYKISEGDLKGKYSLGVFDNVDLAINLVKRVKSEGVVAKISKKKKTKSSYWLEYELAFEDEKQEILKEISALMPKAEKKREIFCKSVASGK